MDPPLDVGAGQTSPPPDVPPRAYRPAVGLPPSNRIIVVIANFIPAFHYAERRQNPTTFTYTVLGCD